MDGGGFFLGDVSDPGTGDRTGPPVTYPPAELTTHGVIVGMTGSGKTGLGVVFVEEALRAGIPALVIDPKGDMANLLLTFPSLEGSDFEPWMDEAEARTEGIAVAELAARTADRWRKGLESWGLDGAAIGELRDAASLTVYTPGSAAGVGVNVVGSLARPHLDWETGEEALRDEIQAFVSGLLGLIGVDADPISSPEHILVANLIEHAWRDGEDLDMAILLSRVQTPPIRKLGVFDVESFIPTEQRTELAMKINGLLASPAFAEWGSGAPLDMHTLLWEDDGRPRGSVVYLAHLPDAERQFVVTLLLSRLVTWMRSQPGSADLRVLVYMDEMAGFAPPTAEPPTKKPILTLLKQARAYGVGMLLATQNPVDLDYKAMSNAGTWCIGRLQTDRDKARILDALRSGDRDVAALDAAISGLHNRQFLLQKAGPGDPVVFSSRWAMSYLAGPLTRDQIARLASDRPSEAGAEVGGAGTPPSPAQAGRSAAELAADSTPVMPVVPDGVRVRHVDPSAPWLETVGGSGAGRLLRAGLAARVALRFDDTRAGIDHREEWEAVYVPVTEPFDAGAGIDVDHDERDLVEEAPAGAVYEIPPSAVGSKAWFTEARRAIADHLYRNRSIRCFRNSHLDLYSRVDESEEAFLERCDRAAQERADADAAELGDRYRTRLERAEQKLAETRRRADELAVDVEGARDAALLDQAGAVLGVLLGRRSTRSITGSASRRAAVRSKEQRRISAEERVEDAGVAVADLEEELRGELEAINDEWESKAAEIEVVEIALDKTDIDVDELVLVWTPFANGAAGSGGTHPPGVTTPDS